MPSSAETLPLLADLLYRLAHACQVHLHNDDLAGHLRALASHEEAQAPASHNLSAQEAAALASALDKYLAFADDPDAPSQKRDLLLPLQESARQLQALLAYDVRSARATPDIRGKHRGTHPG